MKKIFPLFIMLMVLLSATAVVPGLDVKQVKSSKYVDKTVEEVHYDERYAVILVGTYGAKNQEEISGNPPEKYYYWYTGCAMYMFNILTQNYGFDKSNIFILLSKVEKEGWVPHENFDGTQFDPQNWYNSTKDNITKVFSIIEGEINDEDDHNELLLVELIGHGSDKGTRYLPIRKKYKDFDPNGYDTFFPLWNPKEKKAKSLSLFNEFKFLRRLFGDVTHSSNSSSGKYSLSEIELGELTKPINSRRTVFILQPCHAGGFINSISKSNHVILAAGPEGQPTGDFLGPLHEGLGKNGLDFCDDKGNYVDKNRDGKLTLAESYYWTINHIREDDKCNPLLDDNGDNAGSSQNSTLEGKDGYISSCIYDLAYEIV